MEFEEPGKKKVKQPEKRFTPSGMEIPTDWPADGEIDLAIHDLPHDSSDTEWWYVNSHVTTNEGKQFSFFASFFRIVKDWNKEENRFNHVHALTWAVIDADNNKYYPDPVVDPASPEVIKTQLDDGNLSLDHRLARAMREVVDKGGVPLPDHMFTKDINVAKSSLDLQYGDHIFRKDANGNYVVKCENKEKGIAFDVVFAPKKKPIRHGHNGCVRIGRKGDDMFYYFIPRCDVVGTLTCEGTTHAISGRGWYDHEFGGEISHHKRTGEKEPKEQRMEFEYGWNWLALQLDDGTDITATTVVNSTKGEVYDNFAIVIRPDSTREEYLEAKFEPVKDSFFTSVRTTNEYPSKWTLTIPELKLEIELEVDFKNQEIITLLSKPAFWEGRLTAQGTMEGHPVQGTAFIERHGMQDTSSLDKFFKRISGVVREEIHEVMPLEPSYNAVRELMASEEADHLMVGADVEVFTNTVIKPLRTIIDRGGKSWRSYAILLCIDCVGGDSSNYRHWLAMPEIMHVGSLIVDDIQDKSEIRRGGPTAHKIFGDAISINAGTAGYFLALDILLKKTSGLSDKTTLKIYDTYFLTLRAAHGGQAFDINGLDYLMPAAIASGDFLPLKNAIVCTHRLKSAVPAGNLARIGALVGGGTEEQVECLGMYFESIGIAFQIIDDVLNLRGFLGKGKEKGEDIKAGKVTYPVCLSMDKNRLSEQERADLWSTIAAKPQDQSVVDAVVAKIEDCGALEQSVKDATDMVDAAWSIVDKIIPDSYYKLNLRAFGWYVLDRHY